MATKKHRDYDNDYPSVTEVLGVLRKMGLEMWYKYNTIEFINNESNKGKIAGTDIHKAIENYILTGQATVESSYPDEVTSALKSFVLFRREHPEIELKWAETALTSEKYKFNGTIDCIGQIGESLVLLDWKSSNCKDKDKPEVYDEYRVQAAAYVNLYNEIHVESSIDRVVIVVVAKDKIAYSTYSFGGLEIEASFKEVFLPALQIWRFQHDKQWKIQKDSDGRE